jgi:hypothetical protein
MDAGCNCDQSLSGYGQQEVAKDGRISGHPLGVCWVVQEDVIALVVLGVDGFVWWLLVIGEKAFELNDANGWHDLDVP